MPTEILTKTERRAALPPSAPVVSPPAQRPWPRLVLGLIGLIIGRGFFGGLLGLLIGGFLGERLDPPDPNAFMDLSALAYAITVGSSV